MFRHLSAKDHNFAEISVFKGNGLKIPDAHPYPRLYRNAPPPPSFWEYFKSRYFKSKLVFQHKLTKQTWR